MGFSRRITIFCQVVTRPDAANGTSGPFTFAFVYGIGPQGLSMLEPELAHKRVGETITVRRQPRAIPDLSGNLALPCLGRGHGIGSCYLKVKVVKIVPADQTETIKAMADLAQCGTTCCGP